MLWVLILVITKRRFSCHLSDLHFFLHVAFTLISGFCGARTLPFKEPLQVPDRALGFYLDCRLTSDNEPERRVWKLTARSESSRGEVLYQAAFQIPKSEPSDIEEVPWNRVFVPFSDFRLVRGPRMVEGEFGSKFGSNIKTCDMGTIR